MIGRKIGRYGDEKQKRTYRYNIRIEVSEVRKYNDNLGIGPRKFVFVEDKKMSFKICHKKSTWVS